MRARQRGIHPGQWSESERRLLETAFSKGGRRQHRSQAHDWAEATRITVISSYACGLGWLHDRGILNWELSPIARWPQKVIEAYLAHLQLNYAKATVYSRISGLERAIAILQPQADRGLLRAALVRLGRPGPNPKHEARLQSSADLLQLGLDIMDQADAGELDVPHAVLYRTGLQIALLAVRFWRMSDYCRLSIGKSVFKRDGEWRMREQAQKTKRRMHGPFPLILVPRLERYWAAYRPWLCGNRYHGDALWVSTRARRQSAGSIAWHIRNRTRERFGKHVTPHHFRQSATTTIAIHAPQHMQAVSTALGHGSRKMTDDYNLAGSFSASVQLNATVDDIIRMAKDRRRLGGWQ